MGMGSLKLGQEEQALLDGQQGPAMQFAMQLIVRAGELDHAQCLIPIQFAHIDACFYNGRAHLDFVNFLLEHKSVQGWRSCI